MTYNPCKIALAEDEGGNPDVFGIIVFLPHGGAKSAYQVIKDDEYIGPSLAKDFAIKLVEALLAENRNDDVRDINWSSVTAAIQKHMIDWNRKRRDAKGGGRILLPGLH